MDWADEELTRSLSDTFIVLLPSMISSADFSEHTAQESLQSNAKGAAKGASAEIRTTVKVCYVLRSWL